MYGGSFALILRCKQKIPYVRSVKLTICSNSSSAFLCRVQIFLLLRAVKFACSRGFLAIEDRMM